MSVQGDEATQRAAACPLPVTPSYTAWRAAWFSARPHTPAARMYQARRPALRVDKGAHAKQGAGRGGTQSCRAEMRGRPAGLQRNTGGLPMDAIVMFLDCPAFMDKTGSVRCGLPAEVEHRYLMTPTHVPLET